MALGHEISAAEAKSKLYSLLDEVSGEGREFVLLRRGRPVARLIPLAAKLPARRGGFGCLAHTVIHVGDVVTPLVEDDWTEPAGA